MGKINLVIVDSDKDYLESIVDYIMCFHGHRFHIAAFSDREVLNSYISNDKNSIDILLVSYQMYQKDIPLDRAKVAIISTEGKKDSNMNEFHNVIKYQHTEKLIKDILNIYAENINARDYISTGNKETCVIGVYSSVGGTGKSTVAVALSTILSKNSLPAFYLNLENIPSTHAYFKCQSRDGISNLLYYIREGNKNFPLKLEALRCLDEDTGVFYFARPDSIMDMEEIKPEECGFLIRQLREISLYNFVIADLSSDFNKKTLRILEECDEILYIHVEDMASKEKKDQLEKALHEISIRQDSDISSKTTLLLNKCPKNGTDEHSTATFLGKKADIKIKFEPFLYKMKTSEALFHLERELEPLIRRLLKQKNTMRTKYETG